MDDEELRKVAEFLKGIRYNDVELLGYHKLGENKYMAIGKELKQYSAPSADEMKRLEVFFA